MSSTDLGPRGSTGAVGAPDPRRWRGLGVLAAVQFMLVLDITVVTVALPRIQHDLHFSHASLAWVINGYVLMAGGFLLLGGRLSDLFGRRRLFLAGVVVFGLASAVCGAAVSPAMLVASRFVQGTGEAMAGPGRRGGGGRRDRGRRRNRGAGGDRCRREGGIRAPGRRQVPVPFGGVGLLLAMVAWEARAPEPLIPLRFFTNRTRVTSNVASLALLAAFIGGVVAVVACAGDEGPRGYSRCGLDGLYRSGRWAWASAPGSACARP